MTSDRLKANTPSKWEQQDGAMEGLKVFILIAMLTFAVLCAGFLIFYLAKPLEVKVFIRDVTEWVKR